MIKKLLFTFCAVALMLGARTESQAQSITNVVVTDASGGVPGGGYCTGTNVNVAFSARSFPAMTTFNIELSDAAGVFGSPTSLGTTTTSPKTVALPGTANGAGYKIRVRAVVAMTTYTGESSIFRINLIPTISGVTSQSDCAGAQTAAINFSGSNATSFSWSSTANVGFGTSGTGNIPATTLINSSTSNVVATVTATPFNNGCAGTATTFTVTAKPRPTINSIGNANYCNGNAGAAINFSSNIPGTTFGWNSTTNVGFGTSGSSNIGGFTATNGGNAPVSANVTVTPTANGCNGSSTSFSVNVNPTPVVNAVSNVNHCGGLSVAGITFSSPTSGITYNWASPTNVGFGTSGSGNIGGYTTVSNNSVVSSTVTVTPSANGCTGSTQNFTVTINPRPSVNAITNQAYCHNAAGAAINFSSPVTGTTFNWTASSNVGFNTSGAGNIGAFTATNATATAVTSTVTVTPSTATCTGTAATFTVTVNPIPVVNTVSPLTYCGNFSAPAINFSSTTTGTTYAWTSGTNVGFGTMGSGNIAAYTTVDNDAIASTTVSVTPTANTCVGTPKTFTVTVNPSPKVNAISNATFCNGAMAPAISFSSPTTGATFGWTSSSNVGFTTTGTGNISAYTATNAGATAVVATVNVTGSLAGCSGPARPFTVTVNPTPAVNALSDLAYCGGVSGSAINFGSTTPGTTYAWSSGTNVGFGTNGNGNIGAFTVVSPTTAATTTTVSVTPSANTCVGSVRTFNIVVNPTPVINTFPSNVEICAGATGPALNFGSETPNTTFTWSSPTNVGFGTGGTGNIGGGYAALNGSQNPVNVAIRVIPSTNTCTGSARNLNFVVNPTPGNPAATTPVVYCATAPTQPLTASGSNLKWYTTATGGTGNGTAPAPASENSSNTTVAVTNYYVSQTNGFGCESGRSTVEFRVKPLPVAPQVPKTDFQLCQFDPTLTLEASTVGANTSLSWRLPNGNISTTPPVISTGAGFDGTFNVRQFLDGCGGLGVDIKVVVRTTPPPAVSATPIVFCQKQMSKALEATGMNLKWYSTNATGGTASTTPNVPDTQVQGSYKFYVSQTGANGCESPRAEILVVIQPLPSATISGGSSITQGQSSSLSVTFTGQGPWTYTLSNGLVLTTEQNPTSITVSPLETTVYTIAKITNNCGEGTPAGTATVNVRVATIDVGTPSESTICAGRNFNVPYFSSDFFPSNTQFRVQISKSMDDGTFQTVTTTGASSPLTATVPASASAGMYYVRVVGVASNFTVRGKISPVQINVRELPTATISGPASIFENESTKLSIAFTGENPWTVSYRDSLAQKDTTLTTTMSPFEFTVRPGKTNTYSVTSITNACGAGPATSRLRLIVNPVLSIGVVQKGDWLRVYPSPVTQRCTIEIQDGISTAISVTISDGAGRAVFHKQTASRDELDLSGLLPGQYFLQAEQAGRIARQKILKIQ